MVLGFFPHMFSGGALWLHTWKQWHINSVTSIFKLLTTKDTLYAISNLLIYYM